MDKCEASAQIARRRLVLLRQQLGGYQDDKPLDLVVYYVPSTHRKVWGRGVPSGRSLLSQNPTKGGEPGEVDDAPSAFTGSLVVQIGNISVPLQDPKVYESVPCGYLNGVDLSAMIRMAHETASVGAKAPRGMPQETLRSLQFMMKKQSLGQDIFLIGPPGPAKRRLAMQFCELTQREVEYLCLSQDITEADIKQRREVKDKSVFYVDSASVKAALEGRVLILDGIEKAERNVLPIINNLLENREMALEDGRFICEPKRFDQLLETHGRAQMKEWKLVKAHPNFFVIAVGLPIPPYFGNSLDPPLRSRFQAHAVLPSSLGLQLAELRQLAPSLQESTVSRLLGVAQVLHDMSEDKERGVTIPSFPGSSTTNAAMLLQLARGTEWAGQGALLRQALDFIYPYTHLPIGTNIDEEVHSVISEVYHELGMVVEDRDRMPWLECSAIIPAGGRRKASVQLADGRSFLVPCGGAGVVSASFLEPRGGGVSDHHAYVSTHHQTTVLMECMQAHAVGDFCIVGGKGVGKSLLVRQFAKALGYETTLVCMYKDMTTRDLFERRDTKENGDTFWTRSALVEAAIAGHLAILDGLDMVHPGTVASLSRLVHDRELSLPSGDRLLSVERFDAQMRATNCTPAMMAAKRIYRIHPCFRIIAIARQPNLRSSVPGSSWLTAETCALFMFVFARPFSRKEEQIVVESVCPDAPSGKIAKLLDLAESLRKNSEDEIVSGLADSLSTRALLRVGRRLNSFSDTDLHSAVHRACLSRFLPTVAQDTLEQYLDNAGIQPGGSGQGEQGNDHTVNLVFKEMPVVGASNVPGTPQSVLSLGNVDYTVLNPVAPLLVPNILFYENYRQAVTLKGMLEDFKTGDHLLMIGNQGVGKNKIVDYFLQRLKLPREYIQLHRDTTVNQLTTQPSIRGGVLVFDDSPLVRAVREGYVLVIDEADKAPTHVTSILKALAEDREMLLADGRRIVSTLTGHDRGRRSKLIPMHPDFRMIILANRPGYPFLGNDFYKGVGSVFSTFAVDNPDSDSELGMLRRYGPDVSDSLLLKLVAAFNELRGLVEEGQILYPYSTRELVNVVRHIQAFPQDNVGSILNNVFDFDLFSSEEREVLESAFRRQGIMINADVQLKVNVGLVLPLPPLEKSEVWKVDPGTMVQERFSREALSITRDGVSNATKFGLLNRGLEPIELVDARAETFQETRVLFRLPVKGPIMGMETLDDGTIVCVSRIPGGLDTMLVDLEAGTATHFDPFTSLPGAGLLRPPPNVIQLAYLSGKVMLLYDCLDHSFCTLDFGDNTCTHAKTQLPLTGERSTIVTGLSRYGVVGVFVRGRSAFLSIDVPSSKRTEVTLPFAIGAVHAVDLGIWLVQTTREEYFALHVAVDGQPTFRLSRIAREGRRLLSHGTMTYISEKARAMTFKSTAKADGGGERLYSHSYRKGSVVQMIPGLASSLSAMRGNEVPVFCAQRTDSLHLDEFRTSSVFLAKTSQMATLIESEVNTLVLEVCNVTAGVVRHVNIPLNDESEELLFKERRGGNGLQGYVDLGGACSAHVSELPDGRIVCIDVYGKGRIIEADMQAIQEDLKIWAQMNGANSDQNNKLAVRIVDAKVAEKEASMGQGAFATDGGSAQSNGDGGQKGKGRNGEKTGKGEGSGDGDGKGNGSGTGEGDGDGSGSGNGAGNGDGKGGGKGEGKGGEASDILPDVFEENKMLEESQQGLPEPRAKEDVPPEIAAAAKKAKDAAWGRILKKLEMSEGEMEKYHEYRSAVSREIRELRVVLESLEAKKNERQWLSNKDMGDLDDRKLIDGLTGDRNIYRLRGEVPPEPGAFQSLPKRIHFLFDLSMSMSRYSMDGRLVRSLQSAVMVMEAFKGFESKYEYQIMGHSGDTDDLVLVKEGKEPKNDRDRLMVVRKMNAHTETCDSGDNTIRACEKAIKDIVKRDADEHVVFLLSDANLEQYGIGGGDLQRLLKLDKRVRVFILFIGSIGDQAIRLAEQCPAGQVFVALDTTQIPKILKQCLLFISR
jgi:MoxR-like ATPase